METVAAQQLSQFAIDEGYSPAIRRFSPTTYNNIDLCEILLVQK